MIKEVLFGMDGVLVDSESYMCKAVIMMFNELVINVLPKDIEPFVGLGENKYIGGMAEKYNISVDIEQVKDTPSRFAG
jgi:cytidine deaminase